MINTSGKFLWSVVILTEANLKSGQMNSKTGRCEVIVTPERKCMEETAAASSNQLNRRCSYLNSQHPDFLVCFVVGFFFS